MGKFDPPTRTPIAYGYARVSHINSLNKGDSLPSQQQRIQTYYDTQLKGEGVEWGGVRNDGTNISAYRVMFSVRPAGRELMALLKPGDHLILDKVDRIWRSLPDFIRLMEKLDNLGVTVHIVNFLGSSIRNNTSMGEFTLKLFVLMAELESAIKAERIQEAIAVARRKGQRTGVAIPAGCRVKKHPHPSIAGKKISKLHWCEKQRTIMAEIVRLIDEEDLEWHAALPRIEEFIAKIEKRKPRETKKQERNLIDKYRRMYRNEVAYRYLKIRDPSDIPKTDILQEAARQHRRERTEQRVGPGGRRYTSEIPEITPDQLYNLAAK